MRRMILLSLFALFAVGAAKDACAQRHGGAGHGFTRNGNGFSHSRAGSPYGLGYAYLPDSGAGYGLEPPIFVSPSSQFIQPPASPVITPEMHAVVTEYKWPAAPASSGSTPSESEPQAFAIVLKDGSTLSALTVFASYDGLHYADLDQRPLLISMSKVDRAATLKLNRARSLELYLPAAQ